MSAPATTVPSRAPVRPASRQVRDERRRCRREFQRDLFCPCGTGIPVRDGLCLPCYRARWRSQRFFGGNRERVLVRDGHRCCVCGDSRRLNVHHRVPGRQDQDLLITVCAACHTRLHRFRSIRRWVPGRLLRLWEEQHMGTPVQLQLGGLFEPAN